MAQPQPEHVVPSLSFLVAPLQNSSAEAPAQDYLAADITDNLVADLSRLAGSFVIAAASAAAMTQSSTEIGELRKQTGVHFLIRGDAGVHGTTIRVAATMLDLENAKKVWDGQIERPFVELHALERDLVVQIADHLGVAPPKNLRSAGRMEPQNAVALEALLRANVLLKMPQTASTISKAQRLLEDVLRADPASSGAMVGLASIHLAVALASRSKAAASNELTQCEQLLQQALAQDSHHVGALSTLGALRRATGKRRDALAAYEAAADINPSDANVQAQIGRLQIDPGQPTQASARIEQALRLSPLDPQRPLWYTFAGLATLYAKQPDAARSWLPWRFRRDS
jgi:adenylate cyclase